MWLDLQNTHTIINKQAICACMMANNLPVCFS